MGLKIKVRARDNFYMTDYAGREFMVEVSQVILPNGDHVSDLVRDFDIIEEEPAQLASLTQVLGEKPKKITMEF